MESCSQSRFIAAKLHTYGYIFGMFKEAIGDLESSNESKTLETVCRLFGLWVIEEQQGFFLKCELPSSLTRVVTGANDRRLLQC
jgi:acyl-CoA oxidase